MRRPPSTLSIRPEPAARAAEVAIDADLTAAPTLGDRVLVERLVTNLVDNAVRYNIPGGSINVETGIDGVHSYLSVTNTGPLVPEWKLESLFEPFTRLEQRVGNGQGVGLGLSIVASVAAAHGASLESQALRRWRIEDHRSIHRRNRAGRGDRTLTRRVTLR